MQKRIVSLVTPFVVGTIALALGWFAHAAVPLSAQGFVLDGHAALTYPAAPSAPTICPPVARLTYQGRLTDAAGAAIHSNVSAVFKLYDSTSALLWTSATRSLTPTNGLFTVYLGDGSIDPCLQDSVLLQATSIGVTVGADAEMTPRQALNTIVGHGDNSAGVVGNSTSDNGVVGYSFGNSGVFGNSHLSFGVTGYSDLGYGVLGETTVVTAAGVLANNAIISGTALAIDSGGIRVLGAGISTSTPVFIHKATADTIPGGQPQQTIIDNPLTNGNPNAILIVTPNYNPGGTFAAFNTKPVGVFYTGATGDSFANKWGIFNLDTSQAITVNATFNVLVVTP